IAELSNGGRLIGEIILSARNRPAAFSKETFSTSSGATTDKIRRCASSSSSMVKISNASCGKSNEKASAGGFLLNGLEAERAERTSMTGRGHQHLFERGGAFPHFFEGDHAQGFHALGDGNFGDFHGAAARDDHLARGSA